jgi:hypothetical protein
VEIDALIACSDSLCWQENLMTVFGKRLSDYAGFVKVFLGVILVVGILRLSLSLAGMPNSTAKWLSMSTVVWIGVVYAAIRVYTTGFGSYKQLLPIVVLLNAASQAVSIVAILIAIVTATDNVYSAPEYAFGEDGKTWLHAGAHLFVGTTVGSLFYWLAGCLVMFVTKRLTRPVPVEEM